MDLLFSSASLFILLPRDASQALASPVMHVPLGLTSDQPCCLLISGVALNKSLLSSFQLDTPSCIPVALACRGRRHGYRNCPNGSAVAVSWAFAVWCLMRSWAPSCDEARGGSDRSDAIQRSGGNAGRGREEQSGATSRGGEHQREGI
jgi:hypothetical protein